MPEDLVTDLLAAPELVIGSLVLLIVFVVLRRITAMARRKADRARNAAAAAEAERAPQAAEEAVPEEDLPNILYPMPVMTRVEERLLDALEEIARDSGARHHVLAQLSLSAFLYGGKAGRSRAQDPEIRRQLAALQVDFLIVDAEWGPVLAIDLERDECSTSVADDLSRLALDRAGIAHMTIGANALSEAQREDIKRLLGYAQGVAAE